MPAASALMSTDSPLDTLLGDARLRAALVLAVRRRVPRCEVDEIVQATLTEALASRSIPDEPDAVRRWVFGIARHKVVDFHRRQQREPVDPTGQAADEVASPSSAPHDAMDLMRWAQQEIPDNEGSERTLEWMLREGQGEKLEEIAREEAVPAPQMRQRVARMRRHFRARWAAQLAAVLSALVLLFFGARWLRDRYARGRAPDVARDAPHSTPTILADPVVQGRELRRAALERCAMGAWDRCVQGLDGAAALDPVGDGAPEVQEARAAAASAKIAPSSTPSASPSPAPSPSLTPPLPAKTAHPTTTFPRLPKSAKPPAKTPPPGKPGVHLDDNFDN